MANNASNTSADATRSKLQTDTDLMAFPLVEPLERSERNSAGIQAERGADPLTWITAGRAARGRAAEELTRVKPGSGDHRPALAALAVVEHERLPGRYFR
jgi:hypothetical protein